VHKWVHWASKPRVKKRRKRAELIYAPYRVSQEEGGVAGGPPPAEGQGPSAVVVVILQPATATY
jgi:hypothetical protein